MLVSSSSALRALSAESLPAALKAGKRTSKLPGYPSARIQFPRTSIETSRRWLQASSSTTCQRMLIATSATSSHQDHYIAMWKHWLAVAITVGVASTMTSDMDLNTTECSGIVAVVGNKGNSRDFLSEGLDVFKNRGFDGVGLATMNHEQGSLKISKSSHASPNTTTTSSEAPADTIARLVQSHYISLQQSAEPVPTVGMAHTRWATKGNRGQANAHPHTDSTGKIALVHNGTLTNANVLRAELEGKGHVFNSQTDSEVIAKLIGHYYYGDNKDPQTVTLRDATERALQRCDGTWGLSVICEDVPDELVVACNGSSLYIGVGDDEKIYVSSELEVFQPYTKNYIEMKDGEIGVLQAYGQRSLDLSRLKETPRRSDDQGDTDSIPKVPEPYPHWTLKEIMEQPEAIARALGFGGRLGWEGVHLGGPDSKASVLKRIKHLVVAGCGSSLNAARYGERIMKQLDSVPGSITSLDVVEAEDVDLPCLRDSEGSAGKSQRDFGSTGLIVVSQSGETKSVYELVTKAMGKGVSVMSVVNTVGSLVARTTKLGVYCQAGQENGVVSTKTFVTQVTVLSLVALWFRELRDKVEGTNSTFEADLLRDALLRLPISFGMALKTRDRCKEVARNLKDKHHCFVLGKGYAEPIAYEGALKIKEMSYMHAEGYSGGALKHGPFALIDDNSGRFGATPIIMFILDDQHAHHMRTAAEEVKARGAELIIITDKKELARDLDDNPILLPQNGPLTALTAIVPMQLIAYELALLRGINPDSPRNLAKFFR